jgi:Domain of unknown function (DUF4389)
MSAYYATGGPVQRPAGLSPLTPVQVSFAGPAPQSRVTVAFRLLLVVPHVFVLLTMAVGAWVVAFIGWFGALFTGRLPVFAAEFLTGYLRWLSRAQAYQYLLTDQYPPFTLDDQDYPVRLAVTPGQQLNRAAVFFRFFLLIPAWIVTSVISYGALTLFQFASWLIVLVKGQMPDTVHQALSSVLRYNYRVIAFALMLTSTYPAGLFGDQAVAGPYGQPQPGYGYGAPLGGLPAYGGPRGYVADGGYQGGAADGRSWLLLLSGPARKLMVFFIVFGAVISAGYSAYQVTTLASRIRALTATAQFTLAAAPARVDLASYPSDVKACDGQLDCVTGLDRTLATDFSMLASELQGISVPSLATAAKARLITASSNVSAAFAQLGAATSAGQHASIARSAGVQLAGEQFDADYDYFVSALRS